MLSLFFATGILLPRLGTIVKVEIKSNLNIILIDNHFLEGSNNRLKPYVRMTKRYDYRILTFCISLKMKF